MRLLERVSDNTFVGYNPIDNYSIKYTLHNNKSSNYET
jgi:hypothetical protein